MKEIKQLCFHNHDDSAGSSCCGHDHDHEHCHGHSHDQEHCHEHDHNHEHSHNHSHGHEHSHDDCDEALGCSCCGGEHSKDSILENKYVKYGMLAISLAALIAGHFEIEIFGVNVAIIATLLCGIPIAWGAFKALFTKKKITTDLLITIAMVAAIAIGEVFASAEVAFIMCIGEMLEDYSLKKANKGLNSLISYAPKIAHLENGNDVDAKDLKAGDIVIVKNGESIPVDGSVLEGEGYVDQSMITGESEPVLKKTGDDVFEGTISCESAFKMQATKSGKDSTLSRMIALVKKAQSEKAESVKITDKIAGYIVPISVITACLVYLITGEIVRAVTILVVFCPCSLVLSMPTAIMACIGRATKMGVLIKSGQSVENLWIADTIVTDKTGTLTEGKISVTKVIGEEDRVICAAAKAEALSSHPIAKAVVDYANMKNIQFKAGESFKNISGRGIVNGDIAVGNEMLMQDMGVLDEGGLTQSIEKEETGGGKALYVSEGGKLLGGIIIRDTVKKEAANAVLAMKQMGISVFMATGDKESIAKSVGDAVGISQVKAGLLPEEKVELINSLQASGKHVVMLGDGVNDAPSLAKADAGIAMGAIGTDVAVETADVALMNDNIANVPKIIRLARKTKTTVIFNLIASIGLSLFAVIFAGTGDIGPVAGALIHNLGAIVVVLNSVLLFYKRL